MTPLEFQYDFRILTDEIEALANKSFNAAEIDWLLNRSQDQLVRSRLNQNNVRKKGFEMDQKRIEDLKGILVKFPEQPSVLLNEVEEGIYELELSSLEHPFLYFVRGDVSLMSNNCSYNAKLIQVQHDDFSETLIDPFNKPNTDKVIINFGRSSNVDGSSIYFYSSPGQTLQRAKIEYLKEPQRISLGGYTYIDGTTSVESNTDLSEHVHPEIINRAVHLAASIMKDPNLFSAFSANTQTEE